MITKYKSFWNNYRNLNEELIDFMEASALYINEIRSYFPTREEFQFLYIGFEMPNDKTYIYKRQKDRLPISTSKEYHYLFDEIFYNNFQWHVRLDGIFTTSQHHTAGGYGTPMIFFPIGNYRYVFSEEVYDLYSKTENLDDDIYDKIQQIMPKDDDVWQFANQNPHIYDEIQYNVVKHFIEKYYQDSDLMSGIDRGVEIVFDCDEYYLFPFNMRDTILDLIYPD